MVALYWIHMFERARTVCPNKDQIRSSVWFGFMSVLQTINFLKKQQKVLPDVFRSFLTKPSVIKNESTATTYFSIAQYTEIRKKSWENMFCMHAPDKAMKTVQILLMIHHKIHTMILDFIPS